MKIIMFSAIIAFCSMGFTSDDVAIPSVLKGVLNGALAGVVAAGLGWLKNRDPKTGAMEKFEVKHMVPTVLVGLIVGAVAGWQNKDLSSYSAWLTTTPFVVTAELVMKAVFRNTAPVVQDVLKTLRKSVV